MISVFLSRCAKKHLICLRTLHRLRKTFIVKLGVALLCVLERDCIANRYFCVVTQQAYIVDLRLYCDWLANCQIVTL